MAQLLIVYHSRTGGSRQMAEAAAKGAEGEVATLLHEARETTPAHLKAASGYLFCAPENLAALSGEMTEFFDRCYYPVLGGIEGRPLIICTHAQTEAEILADKVIPKDALQRCQDLGAALGAGLTMGAF